MGNSLGPDDGVVELGVDGLQVLQCRALVQHPFVEGQREAGIDEFPVVQSLWQGGDTGSRGTLGRSPGARQCCTWGSHGAEGTHFLVPELWHLLLAGTHGGKVSCPSSTARGGGAAAPLPPHHKFHCISLSPHSSIKSTCLNRAVLWLP